MKSRKPVSEIEAASSLSAQPNERSGSTVREVSDPRRAQQLLRTYGAGPLAKILVDPQRGIAAAVAGGWGYRRWIGSHMQTVRISTDRRGIQFDHGLSTGPELLNWSTVSQIARGVSPDIREEIRARTAPGSVRGAYTTGSSASRLRTLGVTDTMGERDRLTRLYDLALPLSVCRRPRDLLELLSAREGEGLETCTKNCADPVGTSVLLRTCVLGG